MSGYCARCKRHGPGLYCRVCGDQYSDVEPEDCDCIMCRTYEIEEPETIHCDRDGCDATVDSGPVAAMIWTHDGDMHYCPECSKDVAVNNLAIAAEPLGDLLLYTGAFAEWWTGGEWYSLKVRDVDL